MGLSLSFRYKSRSRREISLSPVELARGVAYRSISRCQQFYRVGDVRKARDGCSNCSYGVKVEILSIDGCKRKGKMRIAFVRLKDTATIHYIDIDEGVGFNERE